MAASFACSLTEQHACRTGRFRNIDDADWLLAQFSSQPNMRPQLERYHRGTMALAEAEPVLQAVAAIAIAQQQACELDVNGTWVTYCDLPVEEHAAWLQRAALDEATAHFVAALHASIAHGDLETNRLDLAQLLGRPAPRLTEIVGATYDVGGAQASLVS